MGAMDPVGEYTLELLEDFPEHNALIWDKVSSLVDLHGRVLEMGCGIGSISRMILESKNVEALDAVDMNADYIERIGREISDSRLNAIYSSAEKFCPSGAGYNFVVSINVLEHVKDDLAALSNFQKVLRPGGECLLLVPAHPFLYSSLDRALSHLRRYSRAHMKDLARRAGLEPRLVTHFNPLGALGWFLNGKVLHRSTLPRGQVAIYSRLLGGFSRFLDRANPFPVGTSLVARLAKPSG